MELIREEEENREKLWKKFENLQKTIRNNNWKVRIVHEDPITEEVITQNIFQKILPCTNSDEEINKLRYSTQDLVRRNFKIIKKIRKKVNNIDE
jgi:hypothetical protein